MTSHDQTQPEQGNSFSHHPLFPAVAALWCGAVFALGGMAIGPGPLERLVQLVHFDTILPAAAPPLGVTARLLVALTLGLAGGVGGYFLARAHAYRPATGEDGSPVPPSAPRDDPHYDDDNDDLARLEAAREAQPPRRRGLTAEGSLTAPPPPLSILDVADLDVAHLVEPAEPAEPVSAEPAAADPVPAPDQPAPAMAAPAAPSPAAPPLRGLTIDQLVARFTQALRQRRPTGGPGLAAALRLDPPLAPDAAPDQPAAPAPDAPPTTALLPAALPEPEPEPQPDAPATVDEVPAMLRAPDPGSAAGTDMPGIDEAAERATLESLLPPKRPTGRILPTELPADYAEEAARWALPEPDEDPEAEEALLDDAPEEEDNGTFGSLLGMRPSLRQPGNFVRIDDGSPDDLSERGAEPVVIFPGQAVPAPPIPARLPGTPFGAGPADTEQALRGALNALQKMGGNG